MGLKVNKFPQQNCMQATHWAGHSIVHWNKIQTAPPTSVEDVPIPEAEQLAGVVPLLQARWELRWRDVQVNGHQGDADQTDMDPPLSHLERSDGSGLVIPPPVGRSHGVRAWAWTPQQQVRTATQQSATRPCTGGGRAAKPLWNFNCTRKSPRLNLSNKKKIHPSINGACADLDWPARASG